MDNDLITRTPEENRKSTPASTVVTSTRATAYGREAALRRYEGTTEREDAEVLKSTTTN